MWKEAIEAIKTSDEDWINRNRLTFRRFFREQNEKPAGRFNSEAREAHFNSKLFKMFLAKDLNGLELPLHSGSRWIEEATVLDGNWGWLLAIGVGGAYFADHMPVHIARRCFSPDEALVAGSGKPDGEAKLQAGGKWEVSGSWGYCSGAEQASVFTTVTLKDGKPVAFVLQKDEVRIIPDWNAIGLPLTCSHSISVKNALLSEDQFFDLSTPPRPARYPLASYPFDVFALACFVPVIVGLSRAFWMEVMEYLSSKKQVWVTFQPQRYEWVLQEFREFKSSLDTARPDFYSFLRSDWERHLSKKELSEKEVLRKGRELARICFNSCSRILPELGMQVLDRGHPVQRCWQDLQTAFQHGIFHTYRKQED